MTVINMLSSVNVIITFVRKCQNNDCTMMMMMMVVMIVMIMIMMVIKIIIIITMTIR